jgi:hypothetical protein
MPIDVSDPRSNPNDQVAHVVEVLGRARQRIAIFKVIYRGKKRIKSVNEISQATGLNRIRVLQEAKLLADNQIVKARRIAGSLAYERDNFFSAKKKKILRLVNDPVAFASLPTKTRPQISKSGNATILIPKARIRAQSITIDDIDSFCKVSQIRVDPDEYETMEEIIFKNGIRRIIGESGKFTDWGGESNDLFTTRIRIKAHRIPTAFAFKGKGTTGILTPKKMGKNGDQIQRLFRTPANVFIVQYWGQIDETIFEQMAEFAKAKSATEGSLIYYGIINGSDSYRLIKAYPWAFR